MNGRVHAHSALPGPGARARVAGRDNVLIKPRGVASLFSACHWPASVHASLGHSGRPLEAATRTEMEDRFGHDFADVRVHTDVRAAESAGVINARAFTVGRDLVFGRGEYQPGTRIGRGLLAHELAHVIQQGRGGPASPSLRPGSSLERSAAQAADQAMNQVGPIPVSGASGVGLAREPRSLDGTLSPAAMSVAELEREIEEISVWLLVNSGSPQAERLEMIQRGLETELGRRRAPAAAAEARRARRPARRGISAAVRRRDVARIMQIVQRWRVNAAAESEILRIVERHAGNTEDFDAFLTALRNRHYWGGMFGQHYRSGLMAVLQELEGPRLRRFRRLLRLRSRMYGNYRPPEQVTFWGVLWEDVKEGVVAERIFGYLQGLGEAGAAFVQSLVVLITRPDEFVTSLARFPEVVATFWRERRRIWHRFSSAPDREQARMIGRLVGEIEILLATRGAGRVAGAGRAAAAPATARAVAVSRTGEAAMRMGGTALSGARLGPALAETGQLTAHVSQMSSVGESGPRPSSRTSRGGGGSSPSVPRRRSGSRRRRRDPSPRAEMEIERTLPREAGIAMEAGELESWAARLGRSYELIRNADFPAWLRRIFPGRGAARLGPDMVAINRRTRTIIVGDVTTRPGTMVPMTWRFARQQEAMHIERTVEYARMVASRLPEEFRGFRIFAQERYWQAGQRYSRRIPVRP